ncbi:MAG: uroporphyrinogen-III C-methyltransferase [Gammaproteobacteria bacterium]|nr:uroporphyrinogen-III C-methyltransferase [Gammaproteobacteria bacterium]
MTDKDKGKTENEKASTVSKTTDSNSSSEKDSRFNATPAPKLSAPKGGSRYAGKSGSGLTSLWTIVMTAALVWIAYQQYLMQQNWQNEKQTTSQTLSSYQQSSENITAKLKENSDSLNTSMELIEQQSKKQIDLEEMLAATQLKLATLSGQQHKDWILSEVEYLLKLAEIKTLLEKDRNTAIVLLEAADQKLVELADNSLLALRQTIAEDISNLKFVHMPDTGGIASQLNAMIVQIPKLDLIALEFKPLVESVQENIVTEEEFSWDGFITDLFEDFIVVKHHDEVQQPLMTPDQRGNLNANVQLALQQAQIALSQYDQKSYQLHLQNAQGWIREYFEFNPTTEVVLLTLSELEKTTITLELPEQLLSVEKIQAINKTRLDRWLDKNQVKPAEQTPAKQDKEKATAEKGSEKTPVQTDTKTETQPAKEEPVASENKNIEKKQVEVKPEPEAAQPETTENNDEDSQQ